MLFPAPVSLWKSARAARGLLLLTALGAAALGGCSSATSLPKSFGVNLTIKLGSGVSATAVDTVLIDVTGAEQYQKVLGSTAFQGGEAHVHYVPGVSAGVLVFTGTALDSGQLIIAHGTTSDVTLIPNTAVSALLVLTPASGTVDGGIDAAGDGPRDAPGADRPDGAGDARPPGKKGESCAGGGACEAGLTCADGFCCDTACIGACSACNLAGREGTCSPITGGAMPASGHPACTADDPSTCQKDGTCDGNGACRLYPVGTTCRASRCDATTDAFTPEFKCDGHGVCQSNIAIACAPFRCKDASVCWATCTDGTQCAAGKSCVNSSCGLKPNGAMCNVSSECMNSFCADGVCCDRACTAGCEACNLPGKSGTCAAVPMGQDPKGICPAGAAENAVCSPGGCDGTGGANCRKDTMSQCRVGTCVAGVAVNPATCQSNGACPTLSQTPCGVYTCGPMACNGACADDSQCVPGYYCASNGSCLQKKGPGIGCGATNECGMNLTCVDGVCCMTSMCGPCRNCGAMGQCSITVTNADDTTGRTCSGTNSCNAAGDCVLVNGQSCGLGGSGSSCLSGNCVDGVCCSVATCGACRNCGTTGTCSITVTSADDTSGTTCSNDQSCDPMGNCKPRWMQVGKVATVEAPESNFVVGLGNLIYFANSSSSSGGAQYFKSFNVATSVFADEKLTNNPLCTCGYGGILVGQPADNRVYYAGNDARYYTGATGWTAMGGTYPPRGEASTAVLGKRVYYVGGRGSLSSVQAYDTSSASWITTGLADAPMGIDQGCAGAIGGVVYAFGGGGNVPMMAYTESTNRWASVSAMSPRCFMLNLPVWRNKLVMVDGNGVEVFNPTLQQWEPPVPLPALANAYAWSVAVAGTNGDLYMLGWTGGATYIYKWVFN